MKIELKPQEVEYICQGLELLIGNRHESMEAWISSCGYNDMAENCRKEGIKAEELRDKIQKLTNNTEIEERPCNIEDCMYISAPKYFVTAVKKPKGREYMFVAYTNEALHDIFTKMKWYNNYTVKDCENNRVLSKDEVQNIIASAEESQLHD